MVCPSCGKHVAGTGARCSFCGAAVKPGTNPARDSIPPAGGTAPRASEELSRHGREAIACLLLGIVSFATVPVAACFGVEVPRAVMVFFFVTAIPAGVLALILGRRAGQVIRRIGGKIFGVDMALPGMVLGAIRAGSWCLYPVALLLPNRLPGVGVTPVGSLRTIHTAAAYYSCIYGHGYPVKLAVLGPLKLGDSDSPERNDQAAALIDEFLAAGTKVGYRFSYVAGPVDSQGKVQTYTVHADPVGWSTGDLHYFTDQSGVVREQSKRPATASSPPVKDGGGGERIDCSKIPRYFFPPKNRVENEKHTTTNFTHLPATFRSPCPMDILGSFIWQTCDPTCRNDVPAIAEFRGLWDEVESQLR